MGAPSESKTEAKILARREVKIENEAVAVVSEAGPVNTTKRSAEGNLRSKRQRMLEYIPSPEGMHNENMGGSIAGPAFVPVPARKSKKKVKDSQKKTTGLKNVLGYIQKYDLTTELATAPTSLTFGQLLRGDAEDARKDLKKVLRIPDCRKRVAGTVSGQLRRIILVPVKVHGHNMQALFDSGAIPNLMFADSVGGIGLKIYPTTKKDHCGRWVHLCVLRHGQRSSCFI